MERLNGWQRLWVLVSCLLGAVAAVLIVDGIETERQLTTWYKADKVMQSMEIEHIQKKDAGIEPRSIYDTSDKTVAEVDERSKETDQRYQRDLLDLPGKQFKHVATGIGIWLGLCVSLYVMGWLIGWVIRGFRPNAV